MCSFTVGRCILDECFWLCPFPLQCPCRSKPVRLHLSAAARLALLIMGRTPHRGRPSCDPSSARPVVLRLILKHLSFITKIKTLHDGFFFGFWKLEKCSFLHCFSRRFFFCLHLHSNYGLCISRFQILMSSSIIFWFQIKRRRRRDEAASQQALPSTNLTVGNSDLGLVPLHCWSFH